MEDGKPNLLVQDLHGVHGVRYLFRSVTAPDARPLELDVRADGLFRLWVNGQVVAKRDREEAPGEGPVTTTVHLRPGKNEFLLKIVTVQGASYFTFRPDLGSSEVLTGDVAAIMAAAAATQPAVNAAKLGTISAGNILQNTATKIMRWCIGARSNRPWIVPSRAP